MKDAILAQLNAACPWRDTLYWYDTIDSTNTQAKKLAQNGAPHGTVLIARTQTAGRGRLGRNYVSDADMGVYLSVILRPQCPPDRLMHLTCAVAVAMCDAVQQIAGFRPGVKWINDLVFEKRKLGGILTELSIDTNGMTNYAVVGVGINCRQSATDFPHALQNMAGSLSMVTGKEINIASLAAAMINAIYQMNAGLFAQKDALLAQYRRDCVTLGQDVSVLRGSSIRHGKAVRIDEDGSLWVNYPDGSCEAVNSGEVSIRGMYGYLD